MTYYDDRDPNSLDTLERFASSIEWACNGHFTNSDVEEAKLSVFSQVLEFIFVKCYLM